jgi:hypothetical protein
MILSWNFKNFVLIYLTSKEPDKIFKSLNFSSIPEKLLITIIQNDNLQMEGQG